MTEQTGFSTRTDGRSIDALIDDNASPSSDASIQAALASLSAQPSTPVGPRPGELSWRLTTLIFPAVLLLFVALYVTSLTAGVEPEIALFRAGSASVILAVLGRVAVGILGDGTRLSHNAPPVVAMDHNESVREYLAGVGAEHGPAGADQPPTAAQTAGAGGRE